MPNTALIETIDQLRDSYSQRQRTTNALIAALKGTTGALTKASRALKEYAEQRSTALGEVQQSFAEGASAAQLRETIIEPLSPELRREVKTLGALLVALKDASVALQGESVDVVKLARATSSLQNAKFSDPALDGVITDVQQELDQAQRELASTFGEALRHALAAQGVDLRGRPPRFEIERFDVDTNFVKRTATIKYGKELVANRVALSVPALMAAYRRERKAIMERAEDGARWLEQLHTAWTKVPHRAEGRANIVECYVQMVLLRQARKFASAPTKASFVDYTRAQFAYDFAQFANRDDTYGTRLHVASHGATKSQAGNDEKSIWIVDGPSPNDGHYIADIVFSGSR